MYPKSITVNKLSFYHSVLPSPTPADLRPSFASTFPRSSSSAPSRTPSTCACCKRSPVCQMAATPNRPLPHKSRSRSDDEINVCPPSLSTTRQMTTDYKTCYEGDIQNYLTGTHPELPLCLQNIILQHVQNAETVPDRSKEVKKKMAKFFVVPEDPSDPAAFTETFPQVQICQLLN